VYRRLFGQGMSPAAAAAAPDELLDLLRLAGRRKGNARTGNSLMHAIDGFRRPRPESVMTDAELRRICMPTMFCWGTEDPFLSPPRHVPPSPRSPERSCMRFPAATGPGWTTLSTAPGW
jgi:pimeloyl-ACP methyl ester carboxylesterase